jgi:flavin-dependent dehydrogenase
VTTRQCDVLVAGGGPAGAIAALVLARAGRRVVLADVANGAGPVGEALPPAVHPLLADLQLLPRIVAGGHRRSVANASAWGAVDLQHADFIFDVHGSGWHLDRARFDASLRAAAAEAGAAIVSGARVDARGPVQLRARGRASAVDCAWIVDATGRASTIATARGATRHTDDALLAFHARFRPAGGTVDRDSRTLIESCEDGWWYTTRLPSGDRAVAFLTDRDLARDPDPRTREGLIRRVARTTHIRATLDAIRGTMCGRPRGAPASSGRLDVYAGDAWLAAGDAAMTFDPLSSQGIFNAMYTGMKAGAAIDAALGGDTAGVAEYASRLGAIDAAYRRNLAAFYALERRWPDEPFWRRRHAGGEVG